MALPFIEISVRIFNTTVVPVCHGMYLRGKFPNLETYRQAIFSSGLSPSDVCRFVAQCRNDGISLFARQFTALVGSAGARYYSRSRFVKCVPHNCDRFNHVRSL